MVRSRTAGFHDARGVPTPEALEALDRIRWKYAEHNFDRHARALIRDLLKRPRPDLCWPEWHGLEVRVNRRCGPTALWHSRGGGLAFTAAHCASYWSPQDVADPECACYNRGIHPFGIFPSVLKFLTAAEHAALRAQPRAHSSRGGEVWEVARCSHRPGAHRAPIVWGRL